MAETNGHHPTETHGQVKSLREMRADLVNLQKVAACALGHLEALLQELEKEPHFASPMP